MSQVTLSQRSTFNRPEILSLQEAQKIEAKTETLGRRLNHIALLPPGIYEWGDVKVSTTGRFLAGGFPLLGNLLKGLEHGQCKPIAEKTWKAIFQVNPSQEKNQQLIEHLEKQISRLKQ